MRKGKPSGVVSYQRGRKVSSEKRRKIRLSGTPKKSTQGGARLKRTTWDLPDCRILRYWKLQERRIDETEPKNRV